MNELELWGGVECTVNRVGDSYVDQLEQSGHAERDDDIDRMASLGIRTWRYPILWERVAPGALADADWRWPDRRLSRMQRLGLEPIAGLVHHGSGPAWTGLLDPAFPDHLAAYARAVAERYPWIRRWTPVNEPLSTARFSALDGHWYPHTTCPFAFARAIVNECKGIAASMKAIRQVNPAAELVFTEDVCRHLSTPGLQRETAFRNDRRWLAMDLVCGRLVPDHPLYDWLLAHGVERGELAAFVEEPTVPAVLGANYYVTSDRFLDEQPERQDPERRFHGADGPYGETEAVRTTAAGLCGHRAMLTSLWERYRLPVALTEVHLGCTREEQVRWLVEAWDAAVLARGDGADVRAVTAWGAFGLFGWNRLAVRPGGVYEPGLFDVRDRVPRPTALARVASDLAAGRTPEVPWGGPGWWRRPGRLLGRAPVVAVEAVDPPLPALRPSRPLLVTGAGAFARELLRAAEHRGIEVVAPGRSLDVTDRAAVEAAVAEIRPWAVVHAAGIRDPRQAERDPARCVRLHTRAPAILGAVCAAHQARLAVLSSSRVLSPPGPHTENARVGPTCILGAAQAEGERLLLEAHPAALVVRAGVLIGLDRPDDPLRAGLALLRDGGRWIVPADASAVLGNLLAHAVLDLLADDESGVWHVAHRRSLCALARQAAVLAELDPQRVVTEATGAARLATARGAVLSACTPGLRALVATVPVVRPDPHRHPQEAL